VSDLGVVTQISPLRVRKNGDTTDTPASAMSDFAGSTVGTTEVVIETIENRRFATRVL
jgi:hypothetical protein